MAKKTHTRKTAARELFFIALPFFEQRYRNFTTRNAYTNNYRRFIRYCCKYFKAKEEKDCRPHVQEYADYLQTQDFTPSTIHTYLAPVCAYFNIPMSEIKKPIRHVSEYTKGRSDNGRTERANNNPDNPKYTYTTSFQNAVGIRRSELMNLRGSDLLTDESGYLCVFVKRGKGGKQQYQRILPQDVDFVRSYFDGITSDKKIFEKKELSNNVSYHTIRAILAKRAYNYYIERMQNEEGYREQLKAEVSARFLHFCKDKKTGAMKAPPESEITGTYSLRGKNKTLATEHGLPTTYDKLALMAVSVFHLSHWRLDVTVQSYMLAY